MTIMPPSEKIDFPLVKPLCDCIRSPSCTCGDPLTFLEKVRRELGDWYYFLLYLGLVILISFFITLGVYLVYRSKNYDCPFKRAIKYSWPWRILVFGVPIIFLFISIGVIWISDKLS